MKLRVSLFSAFLLIILNAHAQNSPLTVSFKNASDTISETFGENGFVLESLDVILTKTGDIPDSISYQFNVRQENISPVDKDVELVTKHFSVLGSDFASTNEITVPIYFKVFKDTLLETDEMIKLIVESVEENVSTTLGGQDETTVTFTNGTKDVDYMEASLFDPLRITIGANFDFKETVSSTLYFDAMAFKPDLFQFGQNNTWRNYYFGFYTSVYNNNYSSIDSLDNSRTYYSEEDVLPGDSVLVLQDDYQVVSNTSIKNVAIEGGFTWGYYKVRSPGETVTLTLLIPEFSARRRAYSTVNTYTLVDQDSLFISANNEIDLTEKPNFYNRVDHETSLGGGLILQYKNIKFGEFMAKMTSGVSWLNSDLQNDVYFSCRLQYVDPKVGINLGTEVRGFSGQARDRYIGVYLSKSFSLRKLTTF